MGDPGAAERAKKRAQAEKRAADEAARQVETADVEKTRELEERLKYSCHRWWVVADMTSFVGSCVGALGLICVTVLGVDLYSIWQKPDSPDVVTEWWVAAAAVALGVALLLFRMFISRQVQAGGEAAHDKDVLTLSAGVLGEKGDDRVDSVRAARLLFRDVVDGVLRPLGEKRRVVRVEVGS
jgi:hypothetical protein